MNTVETWRTESISSNETEQLGEKIGRNLKGGETIELVSDLGGGKTTFVRGLAKGIGSQDRVASPSFTIKREYYTKNLEMHHFDFHRLQGAGEMQHDLAEVVNQPHKIAVVEWANIVQDVLPVGRLTINIKPIGEDSRTLVINYPPKLSYVLEGLK